MKVFISQPMRGKTDKEIWAERSRAYEAAMQITGEDVEVINSFFQGAPVDAGVQVRVLPAPPACKGAYRVQVNDKGYILCPHCGKPTKTRTNPDTVLQRFPLFCPWCKRESIISN